MAHFKLISFKNISILNRFNAKKPITELHAGANKVYGVGVVEQ